MRYGSLVLDMDGVVLNYEGDGFKWKYDAVREALREEGIEVEELTRGTMDAFIGDQGVDALVEVCNDYGLEAAEVWNRVAEKTTFARLDRIREGVFTLYPEVGAVLDELRAHEVQLGLISNAPEDAVEMTVKYFGLRDHFKFFRGITDFEDLSDRKPHPDHLEFAKAELKREPYLYAGDAESDLIAARRAGMDSVWVKRSDASVDVRPDYEARDLREVRRIVENGSN